MSQQSTSSGGEQQEVENSHSHRVDKDSLGVTFSGSRLQGVKVRIRW